MRTKLWDISVREGKIHTEINVLLWLRTDIPESFPDVVTQATEPKESCH